MGRGLSPLQRTILTKAATVDRLYLYDIVREWTGWPLTRTATQPYRSHGVMAHGLPVCSQKFSARRVGKATYHATMVTISRAVQRLEARGLLWAYRSQFRRHTCVTLTEAGKLLVDSFCVNDTEGVNQ